MKILWWKIGITCCLFLQSVHPISLTRPILPEKARLEAKTRANDAVFLSHDENLFPLSEDLKPRVDFWIDVYTKYDRNDYIIHDSNHLTVIYTVINADSLFDNPQAKRKEISKLVKRVKKKYSKLLRELANTRNFTKLKGEKRKLFERFDYTTNRQVYRRASKNIRVQQGLCDRFLQGLVVSGRYMSHMRRIFRKYGLPEQLTVLPHVESSFNIRAYSKAGAAGLWQFTRRTGRKYLRITYEIDERFDPLLATEAAAKLLKKSYQELGSWPLAITAYNHGLQGMKRAKNHLDTKDIDEVISKYHSRFFGFASKNFYAEFLAALKVVENYQQYFGEVEFEPPFEFKEFELPTYLSIKTIKKYFGLDEKTIREYNPALRRPVLRGSKYLPKGYRLRLPVQIDPQAIFARLPVEEKFTHQKHLNWYRVRRGDTLSKIARRFNTSVATLMTLNDIGNAHRIRAGDIIRLPAGHASPEGSGEVEIALKSPSSNKALTEKDAKNIKTASTASADSQKISPPFKATIPEQKLKVTTGRKIKEGWITVEPDETLGHLADWLQVPTQRLRQWNRLRYGEDIHIGQRLRLRFEKVTLQDFEEARLEYHRGIEEDFFSNYQITGTRIHKMRRGENIWTLCYQVYDLPFWLVRNYNIHLNLFKLKPGDKIVVPIVEDKTNGTNNIAPSPH